MSRMINIGTNGPVWSLGRLRGPDDCPSSRMNSDHPKHIMFCELKGPHLIHQFSGPGLMVGEWTDEEADRRCDPHGLMWCARCHPPLARPDPGVPEGAANMRVWPRWPRWQWCTVRIDPRPRGWPPELLFKFRRKTKAIDSARAGRIGRRQPHEGFYIEVWGRDRWERLDPPAESRNVTVRES